MHAAILRAAMDDNLCDEHGVALPEGAAAEPPPCVGEWVGGGGCEHKGVVYRTCLDVFAALGRRSSVVRPTDGLTSVLGRLVASVAPRSGGT
jgi:hypothetical protein